MIYCHLKVMNYCKRGTPVWVKKIKTETFAYVSFSRKVSNDTFMFVIKEILTEAV